MQQELIDMLRNLQHQSTSSDVYQAFESNVQNEEFVNEMCSIVLNQENSLSDRKFVILVLKAFHLFIPIQCLEQLFPLITDENLQQLIAQLFLTSYGKEKINETIFPILFENIANHTADQFFLKGAIDFFSQYVEMYKTRNANIMNALLEVLHQTKDLSDELMMYILDTIIKQMLLIPCEYEDIRNQDLFTICQILKSIDIENANVLMIEHILAFINERINFYDEVDLFDEAVYERLIEILDVIIGQCPLSTDQIQITTTLYYLIRILKEKNILIPFEKLFPILVMSDEQLNRTENDVNYMYKTRMTPSDNYYDSREEEEEIEEDQESQSTSFSYSPNDEEEEEEYSNEYDAFVGVNDLQENEDEIECIDTFWARNSWKCFHRAETLNDLQNLIRIYIVTRDDEYIQGALEMCFECINQNANINIAILLLIIEIDRMIEFDFNPFEFNTFDNVIIQYLLINHCNHMILSREINESDPFYLFMQQFDFSNYAALMLSTDEPINILCLFDIITNSPRELIDPTIYANALLKVITIALFSIEFNEDKVDILEKVFFYLSPGETLSQNTENYVLSLDKNIRERKSKSIFCLNEEYVISFKDEEETFFGKALTHVIIEMKDFSNMITRIAKLIKYFASGDIKKYISRQTNIEENNDDETVVDLSNYSIYFPDIVHMFQQLLQKNIWKDEIIDNYFTLFSQTFINIFVPEDEQIMGIIDASYEAFISLDLEILLKIDTLDQVFRIFIKYGKLENLDSIILNICEARRSLVNILIYEISFILMNQAQVFNEEVVLHLSLLLRNLIRQEPRLFIKSIICIYARVALFNNERFEAILAGENIEEFILHLIDTLSIDLFKYYCELEQRMIIAFFGLYSSNQEIAKTTENLLVAMIQTLDELFSEPNNEIGAFKKTSSLGLIKESIFYDDNEFLSHPFISASLSNLIHEIQADGLVGNFFEKYPIL